MSAVTAVGDDYLVFCAGVRAICGIDLTQYRRPQMERRLRSFFERRGITSLSDSLPGLQADRTELEALLDRVTINVSQLWRHPEQWERLQSTVLPELAATGRVRAWSAGCSYGAEAYTLAAVCQAGIAATATRVSILGTDIDRRMIARAQAGVFSDADARGVAPGTMAAGFERMPGGWRVREALRRMTRFEAADLLRSKPRPHSYDLVMCRNTVIYFSEPVRDKLHSRLAQSLRPGGFLLVGATERVADPASLQLVPTAPFFYRKA